MQLVCIRTTWFTCTHKNSKFCFKTRSPPPLLPFKGRATTVQCNMVYYVVLCFYRVIQVQLLTCVQSYRMFLDRVWLQGQGFTLAKQVSTCNLLVNLTLDNKHLVTKSTLDDKRICLIIPFYYTTSYMCTCINKKAERAKNENQSNKGILNYCQPTIF